MAGLRLLVVCHLFSCVDRTAPSRRGGTVAVLIIMSPAPRAMVPNYK